MNRTPVVLVLSLGILVSAKGVAQSIGPDRWVVAGSAFSYGRRQGPSESTVPRCSLALSS
jgi:hypothetical protein